jgi:hypothetical protein
MLQNLYCRKIGSLDQAGSRPTCRALYIVCRAITNVINSSTFLSVSLSRRLLCGSIPSQAFIAPCVSLFYQGTTVPLSRGANLSARLPKVISHRTPFFLVKASLFHRIGRLESVSQLNQNPTQWSCTKRCGRDSRARLFIFEQHNENSGTTIPIFNSSSPV